MTGCGSSARTSCRMRRNCSRAISAFAPRSPPATKRRCDRRSAMPRRGCKVRTAFIVTADGRVSAIDPSIRRREAAALWEPLDEGRLTGVAVLAGRPRQLVAAPIMAPTLIGWVVFAADLDQREMRVARAAVGNSAARRGPRQRRRAAGPKRPAACRCSSPNSAALAQGHVAQQRGVRDARRRRAVDRARQAAADLLGRRAGDPAARLSARPRRWPTRASSSSRLPS